MGGDDREFEVRPGRMKDAGGGAGRRSQKLAARVRRAAAKAGLLPIVLAYTAWAYKVMFGRSTVSALATNPDLY